MKECSIIATPNRRPRTILLCSLVLATSFALIAGPAHASSPSNYPFAPDPDRLSAGGVVAEDSARAPRATAAAEDGEPVDSESQSPATAETKPKPKRFELSNERTLSRFAFVDRKTWARTRPNPSGKKILKLKTRQPGGGDEMVLALKGRRTKSGTWYKVRLPMRPNGKVGWVRARDMSELYRVKTRLVVNLKSKRMRLYRDGKRVFKARIGIGKSNTPTPKGDFYVRDRVIPYDKGGIYGKFAFGLSAYAPTLSDWPGGGIVGIHGTNQPGILPGAVSHGCIRLKNSDVVKLKNKMPLGTPVKIK